MVLFMDVTYPLLIFFFRLTGPARNRQAHAGKIRCMACRSNALCLAPAGADMVAENVARLVPAAARLAAYHLCFALRGARAASGCACCFPRRRTHRDCLRQQEGSLREFNPVLECQEVGLDKASVAGACGIHRAPGAVAAQDNQLVALVAFANDLGVLAGFSSRLTYPPVSVGMAVAM